MLASHFLDRDAGRKGKNRISISKMAMNELIAYHWPGNIRELEHLVEKSVLLAQSDTIKEIHLPKLLKAVAQSNNMKSLEEHERDYILEVLERCNGKVFGKGGAAEILNIHVSTLNSRMKKLGIKKGKFFG